MYEGGTLKAVLIAKILVYGQVQVALDTLVFLKLQVGPCALVHKLLDGLLQVLKHAVIGALYLTVVHTNLNLQLLGMYAKNCK